jgi:hypothetical protein
VLSNTQLKLLKSISNRKIIRIDKNNEDLDYLYSLGYIEMTQVDKPGDYYCEPYIIERGRSALYEERQNRFDRIFTRTVSVIALLLSLFSLFMQLL